MAELTLTGTTDALMSGGRSAAWRQIAELDPHMDGWEAQLSGLTMVLVDAVLALDADTLESLGDPIRDRLAQLAGETRAEREMHGWLKAWLATARWTLQRLPSDDENALRHNTQAWQFLDALWSDPNQTSTDLRRAIGTGESQVSRVGRDLRARGLVTQRRAGRTAIWELTPRGRQLVGKLRQDNQHVREVRTRRASGGRARRGSGSRTGASSRQAAAPALLLSTDTHTLPKSSGRSGAKTSEPVKAERYVLPRGEGGWKIATGIDGRTVAKAETKQQAVERAKQIVGNAGGGVVVPVDKHGNPGRPMTVRARRAS
jgi:DNA-binding MarR family transcriptional regulator